MTCATPDLRWRENELLSPVVGGRVFMGDDPEDSEGLHDFRVPAGEDPLALPPRIWHVFSFGGAEAPGDEYLGYRGTPEQVGMRAGRLWNCCGNC